MSTKTAVTRYSIFYHIHLNICNLNFTLTCIKKKKHKVYERYSSDWIFFWFIRFYLDPSSLIIFCPLFLGAGILRLYHCLGRLIGLVPNMVWLLFLQVHPVIRSDLFKSPPLNLIHILGFSRLSRLRFISSLFTGVFSLLRVFFQYCTK